MRSLLFKGVMIACMAASLAACGGGSGDQSPAVASNGGAAVNAGTGPSGTGTGTTAGGGSLLAAVRSLLGNTSDTAAPVSIDSYDAAASDSASPEPIS
jgi:hypothetical protein